MVQLTIGNRFGSVQFESAKTELFKNFETCTEPNLTTKPLNRTIKKVKPLRPRFRGSVLVFNLGQNSNFKFSKF